MKERTRLYLGCTVVAILVLLVLALSHPLGRLIALIWWRQGEEAIMDMMTEPWKATVVLDVTVKDEAGNPLKALASIDTFYAIGSQGGQHNELARIDGARRFEFKDVSSVKIWLTGIELSGWEYEEDIREWNFNDLDPGEFRFGPDGRTIIVRHDAVLRSFPSASRPPLHEASISLTRNRVGGTDRVVQFELTAHGSILRPKDLPLMASDNCTTPTLLSGYVDAPDQTLLFIPGRGNVYPNGKHIVLHVCSPHEEDGVQFSGFFVKSGQFGNTTAEAPTDGYVKELTLPEDWFEQEKNAVLFLRLGGIYGKLIVSGSAAGVHEHNAVDPVARPSLSATLLYNPTGSRNLRTTYPQ